MKLNMANNITDDSINEAFNFLIKKGIKITQQRREIISVLIEYKGQHLTTEEIYQTIKDKKGNKIGMATIYRNLQLLTDIGLVSKISMDGQPSKYEILCPPKLIHHHLVCLNCGRVQEIDANVIKEMQDKINILKKFKVADKSVKIFGYCSSCRKNNRPKRKK